MLKVCSYLKVLAAVILTAAALSSGIAQITADEKTKIHAEPYKSVQVGPYSQVTTNFGTLVTQIPLAGLSGKGKTGIQFGLSHRSQNSPATWQDKHFGQGFGNTAVEYLQMQGSVMTRYVGGYGVDSWGASVSGLGGAYTLTRKPGVRDDLANPISNKYVLTDFETKTTYTYDYMFSNTEATRFYLTKVKDVFNNEVNYTYVSGRLDRVTDASSRYLQFLYVGSTQRVSQVNLVTPDNTLSWNFFYVAGTAGNNHLDYIQMPPTVVGGARPTIEFDQDTQGNITFLRDLKSQLWRYDYALQSIEVIGFTNYQIFHVTKAYAPDQAYPLAVNTSKFTQFAIQNDSFVGERTCRITRPQVSTLFGLVNPVETHVYYSGLTTSPVDFPLPIKRIYDPSTTRFLDPRLNNTTTVWNWWETYDSWDVAQGNLLKYTDREAKITEFTYDTGNRGLTASVKKKSPAGVVLTSETMSYTSDGLLDTSVDAFGTVTKNTYNPTTRALTKQQVDPTGRNLTKNYSYTTFGSLATEWVGTDAPATYSNFDIYGNAKTVRPPNGSLATETYFTYDSKGNKLTVDPPGPQGVTTTTYDLWNRPIKVTLPDTKFTESQYDNLGNVISVRAEDGSLTTMEYDPIGGLKKTTQPVDASPANNLITQSTYNSLGWKTSTINPEGQTTTFSYNQRGDLVKLDYPDTTNRQWGYDGVGNVVWKRNGRGQIAYCTYDHLHRLSNVDYQSTTTADVAYGYRLDGLRSSRTDAFGTATWTYNSAKQLESYFDPATQKTITSTYFTVTGRPNTVAAGANTWTTGYDTMYRPYRTFQSLSGATAIAELEFNDDQSLFKRKTSNNNTAEYAYDSRGRVSTIRHSVTSSNTTQMNMTYAYLNGNVSQTTLAVQGGLTHTTNYVHDLADRLKSEVRTSNNSVFAFNNAYNYDRSGNRTSAVRNGVSSAYSTTTNDRLLSGDGYTFSNYDLDGNPQTIVTPTAGTWTLAYDEESRVTTIARPAGLSQFKYNGDGQRVERVQAASTYRYLYNGDNVILTTTGIAPFTVRQYITPGVGTYEVGTSPVVGPVALTSTIAAGGTVGSIGGQMIFNQENALGSTIATRSATGTLGGIWEYDAYGNEKSQSVTLQTDLRFAGKHGYISDPDTGFDLLGARYYIPRLGRFLTQDPIGQKGGLNLYAYCENNPLTMIDPDGRQGEKAPGLDSVTTNPGLARWALPSGRAAKALSKGQLPHYLGNLGAQQLIRQLVKDGIKDYAQEVVIEFVFQGASVIFRADVAWQDPKTGKLLFSESKVNGSRFTKNQEQILRSLMMSKNELPVILRSRKRFGSFKYGSRTTASLYSIFRTMIK